MSKNDKPKVKLTIKFFEEKAFVLEPLNTEEEKYADQIMRPVAVAKSVSWCG